VIDQIFPENLTYLEELLFDCVDARSLHVLLASPGGDGETAIRMVRAMHSRCEELAMILPDMAKSAATLMCIGAHKIIMGPEATLGLSIRNFNSTVDRLQAQRKSLPQLLKQRNGSVRVQRLIPSLRACWPM
jgi:membrane-bound ClpP family serine protease